MKNILLFLLVLLSSNLIAQNKSGNTIIFGGGGMYARYTDTSKPTTGMYFAGTSKYVFVESTSNICDSATGRMLFLTNGARLFDTLGNIIENGDSLIPHKLYTQNSIPTGNASQCSLILPKGSNGLYYVFINAVTDSTYNNVWSAGVITPADILQYDIVDMNANGGMGKVVQKNKPLITNTYLSRVGMMACRHANGYDWWLLKQGFDSNIVYKFLVTADSIFIKDTQRIAQPRFGIYDATGQNCFSSKGNKYAFASGGGGLNNNGAQIFISDFNRCTSDLGNIKILHPPYDSTLTPLDAIFPGEMDSLITGVCFSPNDSFLYVARRYNIYQYDLYEPDTILAWSHIQYGPDTTFTEFSCYGQLLRGIDNRIIIGKSGGGTGTSNSTIDYPNKKGSACGICKKCLRYDLSTYASTAPSNMPDFNLGIDSSSCWAVGIHEVVKINEGILIYPNPTTSKFQIKNAKYQSRKELFNSVGQLILTTKENEIDVSRLSKGVYYIKCEGQSKKVIIE